MINFLSPLEQFIVIPFLSLNFIFLDFSVTTATLVLAVLVSSTSLIFLVLFFNPTNQTLYLYPRIFERHFFLIYKGIQSILEKHVHVKYYQQLLFPITFALVIFLFILNISGNFPLFLSLTSQFSIISAFILPSVFGIFFLFLYERGFSFFRTFHAPGMSRELGLILLPVEILTYTMRPISIICRLCSNIMSGHIIMKVLLHAIFGLASSKGSSSIFVSLFVSSLLLALVPLLVLEVAVSVIQVYVFLVVFCMFLADTVGHHYRH